MMSDQNRSLLEEKCPALMRTVDLESSPLLANLVSKGTITTEQKDFIKGQGANFQQVETLVGTLLKKSDEDLDKFIVCLEESGHSHVASNLRSLCKEEASSSTRRQEKTVSVKVEVSAKFSSSPSSFGDKTKAESVGSNSSVSSDTGRTETQGNREPISPLRSEADKNTGKDNIGPHSSAASEACQNKNEGSSLPESALLKIFEENILDILRTKVEGLKRGHLDRAQTLPILVELSSMHREVVGVYQSSILFIVRCPSLAALRGLKEAVESGRLQDSFIRTFFTPERMAQFEIVSEDVNMSLDEMEYTQCEQELIVAEMQKKTEKLEARKDVDRPLDELAHKEDSSHHSQARKHVTMEPKFQEALKRSRPALVKNLDVQTTIDHLLAELVISQEDSNKILAEKTDNDKRRALLDMMPRRGQKAFHVFMECLAGSQPWLRDTINDNLATVTQATMEPPRFREALMKSRLALVNNLEVKPAIDHLLARLVISQEQSHTILAEKTDYDKRRALLDMLPRCGQKAFHVFMEYLAASQPWLRDTINENLATVTQGPTAEELQQALRRNIEQLLKTDPSKFLQETESTVYVQQSVTVHKINSENEPEKMPLGNILELLETCNSPGQRVFVYGTAGMGKSSLCQNITRTWAGRQSKLSEQFDYVFLIPMRSVRSYSLIDIICQDVGLIPESCKERIQQELELKSILFLLDSFEELFHTTPEVNKLIRRELYPKSTVLVTARPHHQLEEEEHVSKPCIRAHLEDLTEKQIKDYMAKYPGLQKDVQLQIENKFGMSFLSRPINLWLVCLLLAQLPSSVGMPDTQTVLLNMIVQHLMLAYDKKKHPYKREQVCDITFNSPMKNAPPEAKLMLKEVGQMSYFGLRNKKRFLILDDNVLSKADVLAMGLFSEGADPHSITLPHPLFQEYLAALFISEDKRARQELLKELGEESGRSPSGTSLAELLHDRGFENMMRFLVGLSGVPEGLTDLFRFRRSKASVHCNFSYELDLLRECRTEEAKSLIASGLLTAQVIISTYHMWFPRGGVSATHSHLLLHQFDEEQRHLFLKKFYGYEIFSHELIQASQSLSSRLDSFVLGMICLYNCTVQIKEASVVYCHVPVSMLTDRLAAVEDLKLADSTLCNLTESQFLASLSLTSLSHSQTLEDLRQPGVSLYSVKLHRVQGLSLLSPPHCTLPATCKLEVFDCDDVNLGSLRQCFSGVSELLLSKNQRLSYDAGQWSSVRTLHLHWSFNIDLLSLKEMFEQLERLDVQWSELRIPEIDPNRQSPWQSVKYFKFYTSDIISGRDERTLSEDEGIQFLKQFCPQTGFINVLGNFEEAYLRSAVQWNPA